MLRVTWPKNTASANAATAYGPDIGAEAVHALQRGVQRVAIFVRAVVGHRATRFHGRGRDTVDDEALLDHVIRGREGRVGRGLVAEQLDKADIVPATVPHMGRTVRQRRPLRERGGEAVALALIEALETADVSRWPPGWAVNERLTELWAVSGELAFPLERARTPGRFVATTCLSR